MREAPKKWWNWIGLVVFAGLVLANSGCLLVAAGAAGGAAVGYAYYKGKINETYAAAFNDSWAATHTALAELGMPILKENRVGDTGTIETRTADDDNVHISLECLRSRIPAEGPITQVSVRVATFGDRPVSDRVLYQIGMHLAPVNYVPQPVAQVPGSPGVVQAGVQTAPPPLANSSSSGQTAPPPSGPPQPIQPAK
jgi:hypothetical protein